MGNLIKNGGPERRRESNENLGAEFDEIGE